MPAKRRKRYKKIKLPGNYKKFIFFFFIIITLLFAAFFVMRTNKWNGKDKFSLVINNSDNSLSIVVFDPSLEEMYVLGVPGNTEIEVAGDYGLWKVKSLWLLDKQEGLHGQLIVRSITMAMKIPVYSWADEQAHGLVNPGLRPTIRALFANYKSDLSFADKLRLVMFSSKVKNTKKINIDLSQTSFLEKKTLSDGEEGYKIAEFPPQRISAIFSEPELAGGIVRVSIKDSTGKQNLAKNVGGVIEVLGGKISSIENLEGFDGFCILKSKDEKKLSLLLRVFDCEEYSISPDQSFDIEITLGKKFISEY